VPRRHTKSFDNSRGFSAIVTRHPREFVGILSAGFAVLAIMVNALVLQKGPHPAPLFAAKAALKQDMMPMPVPRQQKAQPAMATEPVALSRAQLVAAIQGELSRKGYYEGAADGVWGAKTDAAARDFVQASGLKINPEASDIFLRTLGVANPKQQSGPGATPASGRADPIAELIAPSKTRVMAVQRALADFGYGQLKLTGVADAETRVAIEKFERDRRSPITGQITDRLMRDLAAMTGRPLE
jgi:peptidoglycan hydrolase-like protein with peptidoglycan-binding domain